VKHYLRDLTFSRFDTIPECDRQTDRQTHDDGIYRTSDAASCKIEHSARRVQSAGSKRCERYFKHTDRHLLIIRTYVHAKAQTPLGRFVVIIQAQLQQIQWQIELMELEPQCITALASTAKGASNRGPPSTELLFSLNGVHPLRRYQRQRKM